MGLLSFQHQTGQQYLGSAMNSGVNVPSGGGYSDVTSAMLQDDRPLSLSATTMGSFGAGTSWRSKHIGLKGIQAGNVGSTINFDTNRVDPSVR
jgi:hypothetical protein